MTEVVRRKRRTKEEMAEAKLEKDRLKNLRTEKREYKKTISLSRREGKLFDITPGDRVDEQTWSILEALSPRRRVLLQYSTGKDATAAWFELRERGFEVVPFFKETFQGISFFDDVIAAHEDYFKQEVIIVPNTAAYYSRMSFFNPKEELAKYGKDIKDAIIEFSQSKVNLNNFKRNTVDTLLKEHDCDVCIIGTKASDSLHRRTHFRVDGPYNPRDRLFSLVWRLKKNTPIQIMIDAKIPIPKYYLWLGRSPEFFLENEFYMIKKYYPADYERLCKVLSNLEIFVTKYENNPDGKHILKPSKLVIEAFEAGHPFV